MVRKWFPLSLTLGAGPDFSLIGWSWGQTVLGILSMTTFGFVDTRVWQTFLKWNKKHDVVSKSINRLTLAFCSTVSGGQGHWPQLEHSGKTESGCWHTSPPPPWLGQEHISGSGHPCRFSEMRVRQLCILYCHPLTFGRYLPCLSMLTILHSTSRIVLHSWHDIRCRHPIHQMIYITHLFIRCLKNCATTCIKCWSTLGFHFSGKGVLVRRLALHIIHLKPWW